MEEVADLSEVYKNDDLDDYIQPDTRQRCEQLKVIDPEEGADVINLYLYLKNNFEL